jgi:aminoglycoside 3-N-acetyltransferase
MIPISKEIIINSLKEAGLKKGDIVLVHSNLALLGMFDPSREKILSTYYEAFAEVLGEEGTLCVPAYFYEYARFNIPYDTKRSPVSKELGAFARYVASLPEAVRSLHPLTAIASIGGQAEYISGGENVFSYGVDTPWERMYKMNAKMLFMGIDNTRGMTFSHFIEHSVGVPYMYNKIHNTPVFRDGEKVCDSTTSYVRYLKYGVRMNSSGWTSELREAKLIREAVCGEGQIYLLEMQDVFSFYKEKLIKNRYYFLRHAPAFVEGEIPSI